MQTLPVPMTAKEGINTHLIFRDQASDEDLGINLGSLQLSEIRALATEVEIYNTHAENLMKGLAPPCSYKNAEDADLFLRAYMRKDYEGAGFEPVGGRAYYEGREYGRYFKIVVETDLPEWFRYSITGEVDFAGELDDWKYEEMSTANLENILEGPLRMDDMYSMGFRVLPMTRVLCCRFAPPSSLSSDSIDNTL